MDHPFDILIGSWMTTGFVVNDDGTPGPSIMACDIYEWDTGHTHVIHRAVSQIGDGLFGGTEVLTIGRDGAVTSHLFGIPEPYEARPIDIEGATWTWRGQRFMCIAEFSEDGMVQTAHHKRLDAGGSWMASMEVVLRKIPSGT